MSEYDDILGNMLFMLHAQLFRYKKRSGVRVIAQTGHYAIVSRNGFYASSNSGRNLRCSHG